MRKTRSFRSQAYKIVAIFGLVGAFICFIIVAVGGAFPSAKHGTSIVVPHAGDSWQVGELHTVQWTLEGVTVVNDKGKNITAKLVLTYGGDSHAPLGDLTDWFNIADTLANIIVPSVPTRDDYALYLLSRDESDVSSWSGSIAIFNPNDVAGQDEPPSSIVVTTAPPVSVTKSLASAFSQSPESPSTTHSTPLPSLSSVSLSLGVSLTLPLLSGTSAASLSATSTVVPLASVTASASHSTSPSAAPLSLTTTATPSAVTAEPTTSPSVAQGAHVELAHVAAPIALSRMKRARDYLRHNQRHVY